MPIYIDDHGNFIWKNIRKSWFRGFWELLLGGIVIVGFIYVNSHPGIQTIISDIGLAVVGIFALIFLPFFFGDLAKARAEDKKATLR